MKLCLKQVAQDARQIRQRYHLQSILTEVNCNIGALTARRVISVLIPSLLGNTFVIKAHSSPTKIAHTFIEYGQIKPTYIFRDPRDAMLSTMENGRRAIERGHPNAFSSYVEFDNALNFIEGYLEIGLKWIELKAPLLVRYEDLLLDYDTEMVRLLNYLGIDPAMDGLDKIIERFRPESGLSEGKGLHFSHGKIGRFRTKLNNDQQEQLQARMRPFLNRFGYEE